MSLVPSKTRIVFISILTSSILIFFFLGLFAHKGKDMIINNRIAILNFNLSYFKSLHYFNEIYNKIENNTALFEHYIKNSFDLKKAQKEDGYTLKYYNTLDYQVKTFIEKTKYAQGVWFQANPIFIDKKTQMAVSEWYIYKNNKYQKVNDIPRKLTEEEDSYYFIPKKARKAVWSDVYIDPDIKVPMMTYSIPVYIDKTFIGVVGMDVSLNNLNKIINNIKKDYKNADVILQDNKQKIIASTMPQHRNRAILYNKEELLFKNALKTQQKGFLIFKQNNEEKITFFSKLPNNFSYIFIIPNSELLSGYNYYFKYIFALSLALIVFIALGFAKLINKFLNPFNNIEKRLLYVMDNSWNEISIFDAKTFKIIYLNNAALHNLGYSREELIGFPLYKINKTYNEEQLAELSRKFASGEVKTLLLEAERIRKDGSIYPIEAQVQYFKDENPPIFVALTRDISDRKRIEKLHNEFISTVSHELRTPITSIKGSLSLVVNDCIGKIPKEAKEFINIALNNSDRLMSLVNDILDFEKISAGKMDFNLTPVELMPVIHSALKLNEPYAKHYNVTFELEKTLPDVKVNIDKDRFIQVITNLLSNAAKFSEANNPIKISVYKEKEFIRISVMNYGSEIAEDIKDKIFDKFTQGDSTNSRKKGGTGLGLSICKFIMENLKGKIHFTSENMTTTFFVDLPEWKEPKEKSVYEI